MIECIENCELKQYTTFKIGGVAEKVYFPKDKQELVKLLSDLNNPVVLGGCSNVLISSIGVSRPVIMTSRMENFNFSDDILEAECGARGTLLAKEAEKHSLSGLEFMIGFPGMIGGMVYMNASAHNQAVSDTFVSAEVFDLSDKQVKTIKYDDAKFSYRRSIFQIMPYVILSAKFKLQKKDKAQIEDLLERNLEFRKLRQPTLKEPNIGSIFKNPAGDSAGRLLDLVGAKKFKVGGAKIWDNHANFIVNENNATSLDVLKLMKMAYDEIYKNYMIKLVPEIKYIGDMSEEELELWNILSKKGLV